MRTRIVWTHAENLKVVHAIIARYGIRPPKSLWLHVAEMQVHAIAPERHRNHLNNEYSIVQLRRVWDAEVARAKPETGPQAQGTIWDRPEAPNMVKSEPPVAVAPPPPPATPTPTPAPTSDELKDMLSTYLADVLLDTVKKLLVNGEVARMLNHLRHGMMPEVIREAPTAAAAPSPGKHNPEPVQAPRKQKPVVLLVGLKSHQQQQFVTAFPELHFKFWFTERGAAGADLNLLKEKAAASDYVLCTMEATSHQAVAMVEKAGRKVLRITGGQSTMKRALEQIKEKETL